MNKRQYVQALHHHADDVPFISDVFTNALSVLPRNYRDATIKRLYLKFVHDDAIFKAVTPTGGVIYFGSMKELYGWIVGMYPKAQKGAIYNNCKYNTDNPTKKQRTVYNHVFSYVTDKSEI